VAIRDVAELLAEATGAWAREPIQGGDGAQKPV
jgi:hypothetical protein